MNTRRWGLIAALAMMSIVAFAASPVFGVGPPDAVEAPFSGAILFGPPQVAGPFRGKKPREFPTAQNGGTNVNVTGNDNDAPQNETSIAFNASTGTLMGGANDYREGDAKVGLYRSTDGFNWTSLILKLPGNLEVGADPSVDFGANGKGYAGGIGFNRARGG